jgi:hypothetical protein
VLCGGGGVGVGGGGGSERHTLSNTGSVRQTLSNNDTKLRGADLVYDGRTRELEPGLDLRRSPQQEVALWPTRPSQQRISAKIMLALNKT